MSKLRVYEYAKQKKLSSKQVINKLKELNVEVSNHMSTISDQTKVELDKSFNQGSNKVQPGKGENDKTVQQRDNKQAKNSSNQKIEKKQSNKKPNQQKSSQSQPSVKGKGTNKNNRKKQQNNQSQAKVNPPKKEKPATPEKITYSGGLTVSDLAEKINKDTSELIKKLMTLGVMATKNQNLDAESIELICEEYGVEVEEEIVLDATDFDNFITEDKEEDLIERPAVVTIMGHVDHGKTTLLDSIRDTKVTEGEAGGITQHIGAYQIVENNKRITFLDTPGHAAFTSMRSRGAQVTDIAILVVAADDGVMPQTVEAINHAKAAEVPIIIAVNKIDKEGANPDRVMQELSEHGLIPEDWGGDTIFVQLSAIKKEGIDDLLEMILLVSEVEELKANPNRNATGTVIEAELDKGRGSVATLLVQNGTLNVGDSIVVGNTFGRVRAMVNDLGRRVKTAGPSTPVEITGLSGVPEAGDPFMVFEDERKARQIGEARQQKHIVEKRNDKVKVSLDDLFEHIKQGNMKEINLVLKADVQGSVEALASSLEKIDVEGVKIKIIHTGAGAITESDIILASASNAIVIGFNVRPDANARKTAESEKVDVRLHRVIYKVIEEIESAMKGMLDPEYEEKVIGQAEVREIFKVSKIGTIAGSYITDGKITRDSGVRIIRDGVVQYEGEIDTLKRFKDDVKEVAQNYECGITIKNFNDVKEGDIIEAYVMEEIKRT
ncbi:translation initiation factor IF-2 [Aquibacillus sp. 3ASR75-11]|uniref:Translation initiation factor IF-2 n=1 Tax=Terrihalobacillus insolitus TaxID=2950438 RepID=A0A9X3WTF1_9BACI|nr:translation initiation factor IF-2 [Terrihalobacillus insolitus]MDC3414100.1 translation initiation factor IF-2 [Terrihalobacillus insolitus]MDC3423541.1 translation initiation factor IF-2 [Terrihalobacillus insolitus]